MKIILNEEDAQNILALLFCLEIDSKIPQHVKGIASRALDILEANTCDDEKKPVDIFLV